MTPRPAAKDGPEPRISPAGSRGQIQEASQQALNRCFFVGLTFPISIDNPCVVWGGCVCAWGWFFHGYVGGFFFVIVFWRFFCVCYFFANEWCIQNDVQHCSRHARDQDPAGQHASKQTQKFKTKNRLTILFMFFFRRALLAAKTSLLEQLSSLFTLALKLHQIPTPKTVESGKTRHQIRENYHEKTTIFSSNNLPTLRLTVKAEKGFTSVCLSVRVSEQGRGRILLCDRLAETLEWNWHGVMVCSPDYLYFCTVGKTVKIG